MTRQFHRVILLLFCSSYDTHILYWMQPKLSPFIHPCYFFLNILKALLEVFVRQIFVAVLQIFILYCNMYTYSFIYILQFYLNQPPFSYGLDDEKEGVSSFNLLSECVYEGLCEMYSTQQYLSVLICTDTFIYHKFQGSCFILFIIDFSALCCFLPSTISMTCHYKK